MLLCVLFPPLLFHLVSSVNFQTPRRMRACVCPSVGAGQTNPGLASRTNAMASKPSGPGAFWGGAGMVGGSVVGKLREGVLIAKLTQGAYSASSSLVKSSAWHTCTLTAHRHHAGAANVSSPQRHSAASRSRSHFEATETPERARHRLACVHPLPPIALHAPSLLQPNAPTPWFGP